MRRAYATSGGGGSALEVRFELRNTAAHAVELGGLGMAMPAATAQDVHIGGASGWVEWLRVHVDAQLRLDEARLRVRVSFGLGLGLGFGSG